MRIPKFSAVILALAVLALACPALARSPLTQEGKTSVYQRIVTHPGAKLYAGPEAGAQVLRDPVKTFTVMYIYGRQGSRLEVGASSDHADGWMEAAELTEWPQAITMVFTDRTGRAPVLFFRDRKGLEEACQAASVADKVRGYAAELKAKNGQVPADYPVMATEPAGTAVSEKNFYLLPVLGMNERYRGLKMIEVASIDPGISDTSARAVTTAQGGTGGGAALAADAPDYRTGFAFVIDTTISMKPYIDQTLTLVRRLYDELEKSPHGDKMAFAVVAFRSNVEKAPGTEYTAKTVCDFTTVKDRKRLEDALAGVREATVSTHDFNEDAFAGVKEAVDHLSWQNYGSRVMLLVTDAGPLGAGDPTSATGFSPEALADYLRTNKIYLTALHVKNPSGAHNHKYAAEAYRILTRQSDNQASYIAIDASTPAAGAASFDSVGRQLAESYGQILTATAEGRLIEAPKQVVQEQPLSPEEEARRIAESTGYAMQLQFLGNRQGSTAPQVVRAWIADADLEKLEGGASPMLAVEPAVLLTKGQLSHLYGQLKSILEGSKEAFLNGQDDLFGQIQSAAARMSRDPGQFTLNPDLNLAENGLLDEVLADLPYKSKIAGLTQKDWEDMSTGERDAFNRFLEGLIKRYEEYDRDATHWEGFGAANSADWVYRVPLSMLP